MSKPLNEVVCASIPLAGLVALADIRCLRGVEAAIVGDRAWVRWPAGEEQIVLRVLPVQGAELFTRCDDQWFRLGSRLPSPGWPARLEARPLHDLLMPAPVEPEPTPVAPLRRCPLTLARDTRPHPTTALRCEIASLAAWAEHAATAQLNAVAGVRSGQAVVLRGRKLPTLPGARRYWGERVLSRLGYRPDSALPESAVLAALGAGDDVIALLEFEGVELLPLHAFEPLTRAGVRLALAERT